MVNLIIKRDSLFYKFLSFGGHSPIYSKTDTCELSKIFMKSSILICLVLCLITLGAFAIIDFLLWVGFCLYTGFWLDIIGPGILIFAILSIILMIVVTELLSKGTVAIKETPIGGICKSVVYRLCIPVKIV